MLLILIRIVLWKNDLKSVGSRNKQTFFVSHWLMLKEFEFLYVIKPRSWMQRECGLPWWVLFLFPLSAKSFLFSFLSSQTFVGISTWRVSLAFSLLSLCHALQLLLASYTRIKQKPRKTEGIFGPLEITNFFYRYSSFIWIFSPICMFSPLGESSFSSDVSDNCMKNNRFPS